MQLAALIALARSLTDSVGIRNRSRLHRSVVARHTSVSSRTGDRPSSASAQLFRHDCANCSVRAPSASVCACQFFNNLFVRKSSIIFKLHLSHSHSLAHATRKFARPSHDSGPSRDTQCTGMPDLLATARAEGIAALKAHAEACERAHERIAAGLKA